MLVHLTEASLVDALDRHEHRFLGQWDAAELLVERRAPEELDVALDASVVLLRATDVAEQGV
eukprot:4598470-Lingulodinium_polyedra.AAC.1